MRYTLANPVEGGFSFYSIFDREKNMEVVSIFRHVPHAEQMAEEILDRLNKARN